MKRRVRELILSVAVVSTLAGWWFWPQLRFRLALTQLSCGTDGVPKYGAAPRDWSLVNTYSDNLSSAVIRDFYYSACARLESLRGRYARRTYHWYDGERWDRVTSVVQFPNGYISVTAANNNDNDSVSVTAEPGVFPPPNHDPNRFIELKELASDRLPDHMLRAQ